MKRVHNGGGHVTTMTSSVCNGRRSNDGSYRSGESLNNNNNNNNKFMYKNFVHKLIKMLSYILGTLSNTIRQELHIVIIFNCQY